MSTPLESRNYNLVKKSLLKRHFSYASNMKSSFPTGSSFYPATANKSIMRYRTQKINWQELKRVIVFIDAANIIYSLRSLGWRMDYKKLYQFFVANSHCQDIYFYTSMRPNNQKDKKWLNVLRRIDYNTCILLSGDSDFEILVEYLHQKGKQVVVCSTRKHVACELRQKADKYISLQYFKEFAEYKKTNSDTKSERLEFSSRPKPGETSNPE